MTRAAERRRFRRLRPGRRTLIVLAALVAAFCLVTARLFVWPAEGVPARADAIVMLAGPGNRLGLAVQLARQHRAPVLVVSQGYGGYAGPCPPKSSDATVICFSPDPATTRGEAEFVGRLAARYHWRSLILVAIRAQASRARLLAGRCFPGRVYVATAAVSLWSWPYQIAYAWGSMAKALTLYRSC